MNNLISRVSRKKITLLSSAAALILAVILFWMAGGLTSRSVHYSASPKEIPDTIRVGILNSPTTYFLYRGTPMGFDYEMMENFMKSEKLGYKLISASNFSDLFQSLEKGEIDLIASPVPVTAEFKEHALLCGPAEQTTQVLIQPKGKDMAKDVTELIGRHITVEKESKFHYRLENLNSELGGGIVIETIRKDTIVSEDLIEMVANKEIDMTIVDSDIANLTLSDYPTLDGSLSVSLDQKSQWAVAKGDTLLAKKIDTWFSQNPDSRAGLRKKYFGTSKLPAGLAYMRNKTIDEVTPSSQILDIDYTGKGPVSPYDHIFKAVAADSRFDWRLVAAVAYVESRFRPDLVSWAGARGIMQVMPRTASALGFRPDQMTNPETCIRAGVKLLETLDTTLKNRIPDPEQRIDFILAAYNAGVGHITDAIALAKKYGLASGQWKNGVERAALMKSRPEYYRDPVVKNGYFRARETIDFVTRVREAQKLFSKAPN